MNPESPGPLFIFPPADVPIGTIRIYTNEMISIVVSHLPDDTWGAVENLCSHDNGTLGEGYLQNNRVICPRHGAAFDCVSGAAKTLPAVRSILAYSISLQDNGYMAIDHQASS